MNRVIATILLSGFFSIQVIAQRNIYTTKGGELIFSFADFRVNQDQVNTPLRFTCFFHAGTLLHFDLSPNAGIYTGMGIRNVGFSSGSGDSIIKRRNYYVGIPFAIKIGNMRTDRYLYAGVEGEVGLNYKEKLLVNDDRKYRFDEWFSDRTPLFMPSVFAGVNIFEGRLNLKFKYYLKDFLNTDFSRNGVKEYAQVNNSRIFYFGVSFNVRKIRKANKEGTPISL